MKIIVRGKFRFVALAPLLLMATGFVSHPSFADDVPATQPVVETPVPAAAVPSFIALGKEMSARLQIIRRTVDELSLDNPTKKSADALIDSASGEIQTLLANARDGKLPSYEKVLAVPADLKTARAKLLELIGPDQSAILDEKMQSLRGEARMKVVEIQQMIDDLNLPGQVNEKCSATLKGIADRVETLPSKSLAGDEYTQSREKMNAIWAGAHDQLAAILTPEEQAQLGPRFTQLAANRPSTQPG